MDKIEFEDDAPLELISSSELESKYKDEMGLDREIKKIGEQKVRNEKIKENPPALKLRKKITSLQEQNPKDYILLYCNLCQHEFQHAKKNDKGAFEPYAICQHIVFKGVVIEQ